MVLKKKNFINDEISTLQLQKKWWSFRKIIIFGTILIPLSLTFFLVLSNQKLVNHKIQFTRVILQGDLGANNNRIMAALSSREYIQQSLNQLNMQLNATDILNNLHIKKGTNPLKESLQNYILSINLKEVKKLVFSNDDNLSSIFNSLDNTSKSIIEVEFYHLNLNVTFEQAKSLLNLMVKTVNEKIISGTSRDAVSLQSIYTENITNYLNEYDKLAHLSNVINSIQRNITTLRKNYSNLLIDKDLSGYSNLADISHKMLYELSDKLGNTIALDTLNINVANKERDIKDLRNSLEILNSQKLTVIGSKEYNTNNLPANNTQLDGNVLDKVLSLGSILNLNSFRLETISKIQILQLERSSLIKQKELLDLPLGILGQDLNIQKVVERIHTLANSVNLAIDQVRSFTKPKAAVAIINNPQLVELNSINKKDQIRYVLVLTVLGFLILSIISILRPSR